MTEARIGLGIDFGTSGCRAIALDRAKQIQASLRIDADPTPAGADYWRHLLFELLGQLPQSLRSRVGAIAVNGTSATVLCCDSQGQPLGEALLYSDARAAEVMDEVRAIAPANHTVVSATSSFAKLLWYRRHQQFSQSAYLLHQADWLAFLLHGRLGISDYHNALKLGYDPGEAQYPNWLRSLPLPCQLPQVLTPGAAIGPVTAAIAAQYGFPRDCLVCAGTTDSIAAFLASQAQVPGEAVTSLGSTLVLKLLSRTRIDDARYGIYSHRLGDLWLVGGASNTGGAVLRQFFTDAELQALSRRIVPQQESPYDYYPLLRPGERFPINDPQLQPRLDPRPADAVAFLHGLLESIARIEARGYQVLQDLGATALTRVYTAGGGAQNQVWMQLRSRHLQVPVLASAHTEAAYGTALLALQRLT